MALAFDAGHDLPGALVARFDSGAMTSFFDTAPSEACGRPADER
jgi:hypothetical protein